MRVFVIVCVALLIFSLAAQVSVLADANVDTKQDASVDARIAACMQVVKEQPTSPQARKALLSAAYLKDKRDRATGAAAFAEVSSRYPGTAEAAEADYRRGMVCERKGGDIDGAITAFAMAAQNPKGTSFFREAAAVEGGYARIMKYNLNEHSRLDIEAAEKYIRDTIPSLTDPEFIARAHLAHAKCWHEFDSPHEESPPPLQEALKRRDANYLGQAEKACRAALSSDCSPFVKLIAWQWLGQTLMMQPDRDSEAEQCYGKILLSLKGDTLKEKQNDLLKLYAQTTKNGYEAGWNTHSEWDHLVKLAAYWQASTLRDLKRESESKKIFQQMVDEFGSDQPKHWTVVDAEKKLNPAAAN